MTIIVSKLSLALATALILGAASTAMAAPRQHSNPIPRPYSSSEYTDAWCTGAGGDNCNCPTFQQCLDAISGTAMACYPNPFRYRLVGG